MPEVIESLHNANLGWQFYKNYYESNRGGYSLEDKNLTILKRKFTGETDFFGIKCMNSFELKVNYPGLLTGSGYTHDYTGEDKDGAFKIGFFFDHISGMPYITGHGIKGALRYAFPNHKKEKYTDSKAKFITDLLRVNVINPEQVFNEYLSNEGIKNVPYSDLTFASLLGELIFEGNKPIDYKNNEFIYSQIPFKDKDIFYDCYITGAGDDDLFLGDDYITPHIPNPLKNPVPIKFLKILPATVFRFQFDLKDNLITAKQKEALFKTLILTIGIGAKTNVGYGQFSEVSENHQMPLPDSATGRTGNTDQRNTPGKSILDEVTKASDPVATRIGNGSEWNGEIVSAKGNNFLIVFKVGEEEVKIKKKADKIKNGIPGIGKKVKIKFNDFFNNDPPNCTATILQE